MRGGGVSLVWVLVLVMEDVMLGWRMGLAVLVGVLLVVSRGGAEEKGRPVKPMVIEGMTAYSNLKYLPAERYSGDEKSLRGDYEMMLDLHIPKEGKGPFPVVFFVHGGAWAAGTKEGEKEMAAELGKRGIAFCAMNYILKPKGIFPQVWWDFHDAARYLRKNAEKYNIDPLRFGAYGISAGGWVISSSSMPSGDYLATTVNGGAVTYAELMAQGGKVKVRNPDDEFAWLKPMHDPSPARVGEAGGFSALAWDFAYHVEHGDAGSPSVQQWAGVGAKPRSLDKILANNVRMTITEMTSRKYAGQHVHVPPFFKRTTDESSHALDLEGKPGKLLGDVVADFFVRELKSGAARPPSPEVYPIPRILQEPTRVTMVAPRGAEIYFTTDGTEPSVKSVRYAGPVEVKPGTTVKAISVAAGMTPSGATVARFVAGTAAPRVTGPEVLPEGRTGQAYSVRFVADAGEVRWNMQGDLVPYTPAREKELVYPNNMKLDAATGTWSGTPTVPGDYWVQVWVARGPGMVSSYRNYRWKVTGEAKGGGLETELDREDPNVVLATLRNWPEADVVALLGQMKKAGLRVVSPNRAGDAEYSLLIHRGDRAKGREVVEGYVKGVPTLKGGTRVEE